MPHIRYEWKEPSLSIIVDEDLAATVTVARKEDNSSFAVLVNDHLVACSNPLQDYEGNRKLLLCALHEDNFIIDEAIEMASSPINENLINNIMNDLTAEKVTQ